MRFMLLLMICIVMDLRSILRIPTVLMEHPILMFDGFVHINLIILTLLQFNNNKQKLFGELQIFVKSIIHMRFISFTR